MNKSNLTELQIFEKKRKRKFIIVPILFIAFMALVVFFSNIITGISEELNVVLPVRMTVTRMVDGRSTQVVDEIKVKEITRAFKNLELVPSSNYNDIWMYYENAYEVVMLFEDEDGYETEEKYFFAGPYIRIEKDGTMKFYKMDKKEADSLRQTVGSTIRRRRDN